MTDGSFQNFVNVADTPGYNVVGSGKIAGTADFDIVLQNSSGQLLYADLGTGRAFHPFERRAALVEPDRAKCS